MSIPINDLRRHNSSISNELEAAIGRVLSRGHYVLGPEVQLFEDEFADFCGTTACVGVGSGTDALQLALRALDIGPGDQVATVANAGMYATTAILAVGAQPVYIEIERSSMTMAADALSESLTENTRSIIVTHLYGLIAEMPSIMKVADKAGIPVVEDCAQAHGIYAYGKHAGSWGRLACFSFYPTKNLGALGDAGAIVTSDIRLTERLRMLRQYGWKNKYESVLCGGINSRLDELQAAILRVKLPHLKKWNARRRSIAQAYTEGFQHLNLIVPEIKDADRGVHLYVVRMPHRDRLRDHLLEKGINTDIHYPIPDHQQPSVQRKNMPSIKLPITEQCCREVLTLPCFPEMTSVEIEKVLEMTCECIGK